MTNTSDNNPYWGAWRGGDSTGIIKILLKELGLLEQETLVPN